MIHEISEIVGDRDKNIAKWIEPGDSSTVEIFLRVPFVLFSPIVTPLYAFADVEDIPSELFSRVYNFGEF